MQYKKKFLVISSTLFLFGALPSLPTVVTAATTAFSSTTLLVKIRPEISTRDGSLQRAVERWQRQAHMLRLQKLDGHGPLAKKKTAVSSLYTLEVDQHDVRSSLAALKSDPAVLYAEENKRVSAQFTPNDPDYATQWHWAKIGADTVWNYADVPPFLGSSSVVVAVIDTGVAYENSSNRNKTFAQAPDFATTLFVNGYDFVNDSPHANDDNGHGTHVAATIAEGTHNGIAGAGLAPASAIMPIKVLDAAGSGTVADVIEGITFAVQNGAKVINMSLGASFASQALEDSVQAAISAGVVVVAAAGNEAVSTLSELASYSGVLSVSALGKNDTLASYSNYGTGLTLSAPGGDGSDYIFQQTFSNLDGDSLPIDYTTFGTVGYEGTSQATPQVAAAAALLLAKGAPASSVTSILENTATDLGPTGYDTQYGYGRLNVAAAVNAYLNDTTPPTTILSASPTVPDGQNGYYRTQPTITLTATDAPGGSGVRYIQYALDGANAVTYTAPFNLPEGVHTLVYYATDNSGNVETANTTPFTVDATGPVVTISTPAQGRTITATVTLVGVVADPLSGTAALTVDGAAASLGAGGSFTATVTLHRGSNRVVMVATDSAGAISTTYYHLVYVTPSQIITGTLKDGSPRVRVLSKTGKTVIEFIAFKQDYTKGAVYATGDINGDGYDEIIGARLAGTLPQVRVFSRKGKQTLSFFAYENKFKGGVSVAVGDLAGTGTQTIVTAPGAGRTPDVRLYSAQGKQLSHFYAYDKKFRDGVRVTTGDVDGDGSDEIITAPMHGANQKVKIFRSDGTLVQQFYVYEKKFSGGLWIASGDLDGDGIDEIITGPGQGKGSIVKVVDGTGKILHAYTAYDSKYIGGVTVGIGDMDGNGKDEIITGTATGKTAIVKILSAAGKVVRQFLAYPASYLGGIAVTGGYLR